MWRERKHISLITVDVNNYNRPSGAVDTHLIIIHWLHFWIILFSMNLSTQHSCHSASPGCSLPRGGSSAGRRSLVHRCLLPGHSLSVWQTAGTSSARQQRQAAQGPGLSWRGYEGPEGLAWHTFHIRERKSQTLTCLNSDPRSPAVPRERLRTLWATWGTNRRHTLLSGWSWSPSRDSGGPAATAGWSSRRSSSETHQDWADSIWCCSQDTEGRHLDHYCLTQRRFLLYKLKRCLYGIIIFTVDVTYYKHFDMNATSSKYVFDENLRISVICNKTHFCVHHKYIWKFDFFIWGFCLQCVS